MTLSHITPSDGQSRNLRLAMDFLRFDILKLPQSTIEAIQNRLKSVVVTLKEVVSLAPTFETASAAVAGCSESTGSVRTSTPANSISADQGKVQNGCHLLSMLLQLDPKAQHW